MNQIQYNQYLKLNQADKKAFIAKAKKAGMHKDLIKFLSFTQLAQSKAVQDKMIAGLTR